MALRLFHITEFAQSQLSTPASQRESSHPLALVLLFSLWLASICNLALWQALTRLPALGAGTVLWIGIDLALMMACALVMLLSLLSWRWTLKFSLSVLLLLAALNAYFMLAQGRFINADLIRQFLHQPGVQWRALLNWKFFLIVLLLGIMPISMVWKMQVRRLLLWPTLMQNLLLFSSAGMLLTGLWLASHQTLSSLATSQPQLRQLLNPFNLILPLLHSLAPALKNWV